MRVIPRSRALAMREMKAIPLGSKVACCSPGLI
jgi:hypothetical protein